MVDGVPAYQRVADELRQAVVELHSQWPTWRLADGLIDLAEALQRLDSTYTEVTQAAGDSRSKFRTSMRQLIDAA